MKTHLKIILYKKKVYKNSLCVYFKNIYLNKILSLYFMESNFFFLFMFQLLIKCKLSIYIVQFHYLSNFLPIQDVKFKYSCCFIYLSILSFSSLIFQKSLPPLKSQPIILGSYLLYFCLLFQCCIFLPIFFCKCLFRTFNI